MEVLIGVWDFLTHVRGVRGVEEGKRWCWRGFIIFFCLLWRGLGMVGWLLGVAVCACSCKRDVRVRELRCGALRTLWSKGEGGTGRGYPQGGGDIRRREYEMGYPRNTEYEMGIIFMHILQP